ncbi:hypothetical protein DID75_02895 [Candidatus Marinamargulisbacteria bacterium SCGC AG-410-N11]|nr:hypothetical protein DID75_02895 [Candidatus Marinamargulisbacteria bacterium SCGC AG-410-N11]
MKNKFGINKIVCILVISVCFCLTLDSVLLADNQLNTVSEVPSMNFNILDSNSGNQSLEKQKPHILSLDYWRPARSPELEKEIKERRERAINADTLAYLYCKFLSEQAVGFGYYFNKKQNQIDCNLGFPYLFLDRDIKGGQLNIFFRNYFFNNKAGIYSTSTYKGGSGFFGGPGIRYGWLDSKESIGSYKKTTLHTDFFSSKYGFIPYEYEKTENVNIYLNTKATYIIPYVHIGYRIQLTFLKKYAFAIKPSIRVGYRFLINKEQSQTESFNDPFSSKRLGNSFESSLVVGYNIGLGWIF